MRKKLSFTTPLFSIKPKIRPDFTWQKSFHDHIIRDNNALNRIHEYILKNPENWMKDKNNLPFEK